MRRTALAPAIFVVVALASCGGGTGAGVSPSQHSSQAAASTTLHLRVPATGAKAAAGRRDPLYISRATQGLSISYGANPATFPANTAPMLAVDVSASSPLCTADANGDGGRSCTIAIPAPAGNDDFQVTAWDAVPSATGSFVGANLLSSVTQKNTTITAGTQNTVNFTLNGAVASIFVYVYPSTIVHSANTPVTVEVNATDADANIIMAPMGTTDGYTDATGNPITITLSQSGAATTFSPTPVTITPAANTFTINDTGAAGTTTFTATASPSITGLNTPGVLTIN